jgi:hypothetical protein
VSTVLTANGSNSSTTVNCPSGKTVLGGGYSAANADVQAWLSAPNATNNGWQLGIRENVGGTVQVTVYAICATIQ